MKAVHFGAGNIGRGFIGKLLADAGYHVTFADVNQAVIDQLNTQQQYRVKIVGEQTTIETINNVSAVNSTDAEALHNALMAADVITTAVGPNVLPILAPGLAKAITARVAEQPVRPLNIIACENMVRATSSLKEAVLKELPAEVTAKLGDAVGFVDSAVDRIIPPASEVEQPLDVMVEPFHEWIVDQTQFVGERPQIEGMQLTDNLMAFVERKLFTLNTGHAITAYLGYQAHYRTIREAIADQDIRATVKAAMQESGAVLIRRYGFDEAKHNAYIDKILSRFDNPYLVDEVVRVGRQPMRKLAATDRLIKPLLGTEEYQLAHDHLIKGIIAALHYDAADDEQAVTMQNMIKEQGLAKALPEITGLPENSALTKEIIENY